MSDPIIILTRPEPSSRRLAKDLSFLNVPLLLAPAFGFEPVDTLIPSFDEAIFTSQRAVSCAPNGQGRVAWCVGEKTAQAAQAQGFDAKSAGGDVEDLLALILARRPAGRLLHLRGEVARGNVQARLHSAGLTSQDVVVYRKQPKQPPKDFQRNLRAGRTCYLMVFSAETVSILSRWGIDWSACRIVAISKAVAKAACVLDPIDVVVADRPSQAAMILQLQRMLLERSGAAG